MSLNWYPVIDYNECSKCGACVDFCSHDVVKRITSNEKYSRVNKVVKIILCTLILLLAFYMFYLGF